MNNYATAITFASLISDIPSYYTRNVISKMLTILPEDRMTSSEVVHQLVAIKDRVKQNLNVLQN